MMVPMAIALYLLIPRYAVRPVIACYRLFSWPDFLALTQVVSVSTLLQNCFPIGCSCRFHLPLQSLPET